MSSFVAWLTLLLVAACDSSTPEWQIVGRHMPGAVLSVWGTSATDVFLVGGDVGDGHGPVVQHFDGTSWTRLSTGQVGNLWWVFGFSNGPVYMGGDGGMILRYQGGAFQRMTTPGTGTVFGIWGATADDLWAVGGAPGGASGAFAWRLTAGTGDTWVAATGFPAGLAATDAIWKMYGRGANDAWMVGTNGKVVRWDGTSLTVMITGTGESLFTVHADDQRFVAVGGFGTGAILENDGASWHNASPPGSPSFVGVCLSRDGDYAVGQQGAVYTRGSAGWSAVDTGFTIDETFHSVWVDPSGGVWVTGGQVLTLPLIDGVVLHQGAHVPEGLQ
ncbi:MAG TPA: hypothetical protein VHN14_21445 [Kofleriaceae bacterium]|jgi:hypothetical protein|nr:hypothetical protein [Kofleriaceae bacterium]